ncbi:YCF48-related protein [Rhodoferax sp. GW822-FHT02A01]|uniref:WD40/YVTN/BNR-like repeat-containing protein n=1 Tax=Rhodoferax sp. GW822-FHT02A01 TaxID=3141537 RepID=UPI00315CCE5F
MLTVPHMLKTSLAVAVFVAMGASSIPSQATPVGEALQRPALQVLHPERAVLLSATWAGRRIVAVGERGIAIYSDDGGTHWRQAKVPTSVSLTAVQFFGDHRGWAVGHGGVVLTTVDAGQSWTLQLDGRQVAALVAKSAQASGDAKAQAEADRLIASGPDKPFLDLHFLDAQRGMVVGAYGLALTTQDGGKTWSSMGARLDNPGGMHLYSLQSQGEKLLIAGEQGLVLLSLDAGASFRRLKVPYDGTFFRASWLGDRSLLVAGLRGQLWRSDDLGVSWAQVSAPVPVSFSAMVADPQGTLWLANQAGGLFAYTGEQLRPMAQSALPPTAGLLALDAGRLLALTVQGAIVVPTAGARP